MRSTSRLPKISDDVSDSCLESDEYDGSEVGSDRDSEMEMEPTLAHSELHEEDNGGSDPEDGDSKESNMEEGEDDKKRDAELEELEKEYQILRSEEQNLLKNLRRHKDEDVIKGQAVKNQKALWDKTLEYRFLLQKVFSASNKLPQEPIKSYFCNSNTTVDQTYLELISSSNQTLNALLELQEALLENNHSITQGSCEDDVLLSDFKGDDDEEWSNVYKSHDRIAAFRNSSIDKWHRKTQVTTGAAAFRVKLNAFNQNVSDQINGYMRDPNQMIKRMQLRSSSVGIFGKVSALHEKTKEEVLCESLFIWCTRYLNFKISTWQCYLNCIMHFCLDEEPVSQHFKISNKRF